MDNRWVKKCQVKSHSNPEKTYTVAVDKEGNYGCSCPQWTRRRAECKHIEEVKYGGWPEKGSDGNKRKLIKILANVREVTVKQEKGEIWVPLMPLGNSHFALTLAYDFVKAGIPWREALEWAHLPKNITPEMINRYIEERGRLIYGPWVKGKGHQGFSIVLVDGGKA